MSNYSLKVISHSPKSSNKPLRKYNVDQIDTVGVVKDEKFEIRFKNNTWQKVQVIISLDGLDIFTGKPATTTPHDKMWVVNAHDTLSLKAFPENDFGGAEFVFTNAKNSIAAYLSGDLSNRGIIAAAVFTESYVAPIKIEPCYHHHYH